MKYDFAGWVTKNDILCSDGVTIKRDAFSADDGRKAPLVWQHDSSTPDNVLGHMTLQNRDKGVYGFGVFNNSDKANYAKELVEHGDISSMSIGARKIKKQGNDVIHGSIYEVSLVLSGANPGAMIESNIAHSDDIDSFTITNGLLIHSADDVVEEEFMNHADETKETKGSDPVSNNDTETESNKGEDKTLAEVLNTLTDEQEMAVEILVASAVKAAEDNKIKQGDEASMKHNVFDGTINEETLQHDAIRQEILETAAKNRTSWKEELKHAADYGIENIEVLFPEATAVTAQPTFYKDNATQYKQIIQGVTKSPFQRVKMWVADLTEDEARARGYIKGNQKFDQVFKVYSRETYPQTIYKRQKLDRDDIIDIEDFDVVAWIQSEMQDQLEEELARAILVGDGRETSDPDKIQEDKIRPILNDDELFTIKKQIGSDKSFFEDVINAMVEYRGSGQPTMYIDPMIIGRLRLLKGTDGRYLTGKPATNEELATLMGVAKIVPTTLMLGKGALIVNLSDYRIGAAKGGQVTRFDDFDIDFNQYKYLIETRLSGALVVPFSAIHLAEKNSSSPDTLTKGLRTFFKEDEKTKPADSSGTEEGA